MLPLFNFPVRNDKLLRPECRIIGCALRKKIIIVCQTVLKLLQRQNFVHISCSKFWFNGTTSRQDLTSLENLEVLWQTIVSVAGPGAGTVAAVA
jgi:hypothetical protein